MKNTYKNVLLLTLIFSVSFLSSCVDNCTNETGYTLYTPVYQTTQEVRDAFGYVEPREINEPGRLYFKDGFMYINEAGKGIHVVDNTDPSQPKNIGFINIPGNFDLAAKGEYMYVDSYIDLIVLNISDPENIEMVTRLESVFGDYNIWQGRYNETEQVIITHFEEEWVEAGIEIDCDRSWGWFFSGGGDVAVLESGAIANRSGGGTGIGGSMAKFTIYDDYLYTVDYSDMRLFNIGDGENPTKDLMIPLGWGIETIFPYGDKLFIGAMNGMHIYDNAEPSSPQWLSTYEHVNSCDPVVVQDDFAFVTLRDGNECQGFTNHLEVVDISDLSNPVLHKAYEMENPHGLSINGDCLFITEGDFGLKFFDAQDVDNIELVDQIEAQHSIDAITLGEILMVIGRDGFYQYTYDCDSKEWSYLSSISIISL